MLESEGPWITPFAAPTARRQSLSPVCPYLVTDAGRVVLALPGDPLFPERDAEPILDGATRFVLRDGRFVAATASD